MSYFTPFVTTTADVKETLKEFAASNNVSLEKVTFDILSFTTYYSKLPSTKWIALEPEKRSLMMHVKNLSDENIYLKEQYKIKIYPKDFEKSCTPLITLSSDSTRSKIMATIRPPSTFALTKTCKQEYIHEIKRKLLLSNALIGLFMVDLEIALMPLQLAVQRDEGLLEPLVIVVSQALKPSTNVPHQITETYLHKSENQRSAYEAGVVSDELILEYVLPHIALSGRNCMGQHLQALGPSITTNMIIFYNPDHVYKSVESNKLLYYSKRAGYVHYEDGFLDVSNSLNLDSVSLSTTGSITLGNDKDIALNIAANDDEEDAINKGINIEVSSMDVRGSIAGNTTIKADSVNIGAQTHKNSTLEVAETANVHLHRGDLKAKVAHINILEQGIIEAEIAHVREMLGGEIRAREIYINTVRSNATLIASKHIEIMSIQGRNNKLTIAPARIQNEEKKVKDLQEQKRLKQAAYFELERDYKTRMHQFKSNYDRIDEVKKTITKAIKEGQKPSTAHAVKYKQFGLDKERLQNMQTQMQLNLALIEEITQELDTIQNAMQSATIVLKSVWDGHSSIIYEDPYSTKIEKYIPQGQHPKIVYKNLLTSDLITLRE